MPDIDSTLIKSARLEPHELTGCVTLICTHNDGSVTKGAIGASVMTDWLRVIQHVGWPYDWEDDAKRCHDEAIREIRRRGVEAGIFDPLPTEIPSTPEAPPASTTP